MRPVTVQKHIIPPLVKRKVQLPAKPAIKVITQPKTAASRVVRIQEMKQQIKQVYAAKPTVLAGPPPANKSPVISQAAVSKNSILKRKPKSKGQVRYITTEPSPESQSKLRQLRALRQNRILVIIGNGPSVNEARLTELVGKPNIDTLSINKPFPGLWPTTYWTFFDPSQLRRHESLVHSYNGWIFTSTGIKQQTEKSIQLKNLGGQGFCKDIAKGIHIGRSSVYAAMQIGIWLNYYKIYIFGVDMNQNGINGSLHFYGENPDVKPDVRKKRFDKEAGYYDHAASLLTAEERQSFVFCSDYNPYPFVNSYGHLSHRLAVDTIIKEAELINTNK